MKNRIIYFIILLVSLGMYSCYEEEEYADNLSLGATIDVTADNAFILGETNDINISIEISQNAGAPVQSLVVTKQLITSSGNSDIVSQTINIGENNSIELAFNTSELFADVPVNSTVLAPDDLNPGDKWDFTFTIVMQDGRELTPGRGDNITSINFTCVSDLAGTYNTITDGGTGDGSGGTASNFSGLAYQVTITEIAAGTYEISDITGGLYALGYVASDNPAEFTDICDNITIDSQPDVVFGGDEFNGTGTVNADGTITIEWSNNWGDNGVTTLTPQ